jgi:HEAT repeat protein
MKSLFSRNCFKGFLLLAIISFAGGDVTALEFGNPLDADQTPEEHVRAILSDYPARRGELLEVGFSPGVKILIGILNAAGEEPAAILPPIRALGFMGRPQGSDPVARHIGHTDREVRLAVIRSLGQMGKFNAMPLVERFANSRDPGERREAIIAMGKFATPALLTKMKAAAGADPELLRLVQEGQARIEATLKGIETEDYTAFVNALIDTDEYEDIDALILYTWKPLQMILEDEHRSTKTRERALELLAMARVRRAGEGMRRIAVNAGMPLSLRRRAVQGLGLTEARSALRELAAFLDADDIKIVEYAIRSLGQLRDPAALEPLTEHWQSVPPELRNELRLAIARVAKTAAVTSLLAPLRIYQPRAVEKVQLIADDDVIATGYRPAVLAPYFTSQSSEARRDALLLAATLASEEEADVLREAVETEPDPMNVEIARLGLERLKNIPLWERE